MDNHSLSNISLFHRYPEYKKCLQQKLCYQWYERSIVRLNNISKNYYPHIILHPPFSIENQLDIFLFFPVEDNCKGCFCVSFMQVDSLIHNSSQPLLNTNLFCVKIRFRWPWKQFQIKTIRPRNHQFQIKTMKLKKWTVGRRNSNWLNLKLGNIVTIRNNVHTGTCYTRGLCPFSLSTPHPFSPLSSLLLSPFFPPPNCLIRHFHETSFWQSRYVL